MKPTRREFIGQASCAAVGSTAFASTLLNLMMAGTASAAQGPGDYKALVCLFLPGGNDSFNLLVPRGVSEYAEYAAVRGDLALPHESLLGIGAHGGREMGLHPGVPELRSLFTSGKAAFVANVGSLARPTTRQDFDNGVALPYGLFSHSDQQEQWHTGVPTERKGNGWGGRMGDFLEILNTPSPVSMNVSVAGNNLFQVGDSIVPYTVNPWGATHLRGVEDWSPFQDERKEAVEGLLALEYRNVLETTYVNMRKNALDAYDAYNAATAIPLPGSIVWGEDDLSKQLQQVAKVIAGRGTLGARRQVFYVQWGGWDFHDEVLNNMATMLPIVSKAIKTFYDCTVAMGLANNVTLFSASDFGRSLTSNARGSDHAWGGNQFAVGGAVRGGRIFGQYPDLYLDNPLDIWRGSLIPTTSVDQYAADLALWMGVSRADIDKVLPNLTRFWDPRSSSPPLGLVA